jgi:hypothetical protein
MAQAKFTIETPASQVILELEKQEATCAGIAAAIAKHRALGDKTIVDVLRHTEPKHLVFDLYTFGQDADEETNNLTLNLLFPDKDKAEPMLAFRLYLDLPWLTTGQDKILESVFKGKLPTAESELANGIVKRTKNG